ncbi:MAG TPA: tetratricopeptide repeat protein [Blastocatellia bacterium]|nr:tetratricopeptide repeat protein [Blastocatellia bacterium]
MSSLITKGNKSRSSASKKIHAIKGKKAASRKPARPGRITAAPKAQKVSKNKKAVVAKKRPQAKKSKQAVSVKKPASRLAPVAKKLTPKKTAAKTAVSKGKRSVAASGKKVAKAASSKPVLSSAKAKSRRALLARRRAFAPKPLPAPPKKPPSPGTLAAVRAFEQALRVFNRQDFVAAKSAFHGLLDKFGDQADIVARVRTYLAICEQRLARTPSTPRNSDALYDRGVFEFNRGNTAEAIESFEKALKVEPRADHVFYSLAAAYARLNNVAKALEALRHAIGIRPAHRSHARRDLDFAGLRSDESFQQLTGFGFDLVHE